MAHAIDMSNNRANIAFVGEQPWHGLGQELSKDSSIETWTVEAGMNWDIVSAPVMYNVVDDEQKTFNGKNVLFRSDTGEGLGIVSNDYKVVQPKEVLEFFRDLVGQNDMYLETAGVLFGGRRFWAMANTGRAGDVLGKDHIRGNLLLTTSADGTLATNAQFVATRVVCNNTLRVALTEEGKRVRVTHGKTFDPQDIKSQLGLIDQAWDNFMQTITDLSKVKVDDAKARQFFYNLTADPEKMADEQSFAVARTVNDLMERYIKGMGADMTYGTAWGIVNAVTEKSMWGGRASGDVKMWNNFYGKTAANSDNAFQIAKEVFLEAA